MEKQLTHTQVAVLVANGFEQSEMTEPIQALREAGAKFHIVSPAKDRVRGWQHGEWGDWFEVDVPLTQANADAYDALLLPGGVMNPDKLRVEPKALDFVRHFFAAGKPVAAICHAPWTLIDAGVVKGRRLTSYHSIETDLVNAGAQWQDAEVVVDNGLVTSRSPKDLPAFCAKMVEEFHEGVHAVPTLKP